MSSTIPESGRRIQGAVEHQSSRHVCPSSKVAASNSRISCGFRSDLQDISRRWKLGNEKTDMVCKYETNIVKLENLLPQKRPIEIGRLYLIAQIIPPKDRERLQHRLDEIDGSGSGVRNFGSMPAHAFANQLFQMIGETWSSTDHAVFQLLQEALKFAGTTGEVVKRHIDESLQDEMTGRGLDGGSPSVSFVTDTNSSWLESSRSDSEHSFDPGPFMDRSGSKVRFDQSDITFIADSDKLSSDMIDQSDIAFVADGDKLSSDMIDQGDIAFVAGDDELSSGRNVLKELKRETSRYQDEPDMSKVAVARRLVELAPAFESDRKARDMNLRLREIVEAKMPDTLKTDTLKTRAIVHNLPPDMLLRALQQPSRLELRAALFNALQDSGELGKEILTWQLSVNDHTIRPQLEAAMKALGHTHPGVLLNLARKCEQLGVPERLTRQVRAMVVSG